MSDNQLLYESNKKSVAVALLLTIFIPGAAYAYNGKWLSDDRGLGAVARVQRDRRLRPNRDVGVVGDRRDPRDPTAQQATGGAARQGGVVMALFDLSTGMIWKLPVITVLAVLFNGLVFKGGLKTMFLALREGWQEAEQKNAEIAKLREENAKLKSSTEA